MAPADGTARPSPAGFGAPKPSSISARAAPSPDGTAPVTARTPAVDVTIMRSQVGTVSTVAAGPAPTTDVSSTPGMQGSFPLWIKPYRYESERCRTRNCCGFVAAGRACSGQLSDDPDIEIAGTQRAVQREPEHHVHLGTPGGPNATKIDDVLGRPAEL